MGTAVAPETAARRERAEVSGSRVERTRDFGDSDHRFPLWNRFNLDELLASLLPEGRESVARAHNAAQLTVARFCEQRSELSLAEHCYETTGLDDLLGIDTEAANDARRYRALDKRGEHKDALCARLMEHYRQWFSVRFEFMLNNGRHARTD